MKQTDGVYILVTDGGCYPNPGSGGWGWAVIHPDGSIIERYGVEDNVTNNQMEIKAILKGLTFIQEELSLGVQVKIRSDSMYAIGSLTHSGRHPDGSCKWKNKAKANRDLVLEARAVVARHTGAVEWEWIKGHAGVCPVHDRLDREIYIRHTNRRQTND